MTETDFLITELNTIAGYAKDGVHTQSTADVAERAIAELARLRRLSEGRTEPIGPAGRVIVTGAVCILRNDIHQMSDAERAIYGALAAVNRAGASPLLTEAGELLKAAMNKVSEALPPAAAWNDGATNKE